MYTEEPSLEYASHALHHIPPSNDKALRHAITTTVPKTRAPTRPGQNHSSGHVDNEMLR
jgi:hypothetical protein